MKFIERIQQYRDHHRLSYQLGLMVTVSSMLCTLFAATVQLSISYHRDLKAIQQQMQFIQESYLQAIAASVYNFDRDLLHIQLEGVLQLQDIEYLEVKDIINPSQVFLAVGTRNHAHAVTTTLPLKHRDLLGNTYAVGSLTVIASLEGVYQRLWRNAAIILGSTMLQTFLIAFVILLVIQFILTRPLLDVARYAAQLDLDHLDASPELRRRRLVFTKPDELDQVIKAIKELRLRLQQDIAKRQLTEEALRESDARYRALFDRSFELVYLHDFQGNFLDANPAALDLLGYAKEDVFALNFTALLPPEQRPVALATMAALQRIGVQEKSTEYKLQRKDGTFVYIETKGTVIVRDGKPVAIQGFGRNITERKQAEEFLARERNLLRTLIDNLPDYIYFKDTESRFLLGNRAMAQFMGAAAPEELIGKTDVDFYPQDLALRYCTDEREILQSGRRLMNQEEPRRDSSGNTTWILTTKVPLRDRQGAVVGLVGISRDITERKRTEEALKQSEANLQAILASTDDIIASYDREIRLMAYNPACVELYRNLLGLELRPGLRTLELFPEATWRFWAANNARALAGESFSVELSLPTVNDQVRTFESYFNPIRSDGDVVGFSTFTRDITARKRAEEEIRTLNAELEQRVRERTAQLEAINQELQSFAYIVSHDLKAPLRGINQIAHWLIEDYLNVFDAQGKEMLDLLSGRVKRMDAMIDGILQYSRVGRIEGRAEFIDLNQLVREVTDILAPPRQMQIVIQDALPSIIGDRTRIGQVFQNLVGNAIKFMDKPDGVIRIGCLDQGDCWQFAVADNGPGIERRHHEKIFQIFQTLKPRDEEENTGVGLAIVKKIVEFYGGNVWVESTPGHGSTFWFTLPKKKI